MGDDTLYVMYLRGMNNELIGEATSGAICSGRRKARPPQRKVKPFVFTGELCPVGVNGNARQIELGRQLNCGSTPGQKMWLF